MNEHQELIVEALKDHGMLCLDRVRSLEYLDTNTKAEMYETKLAKIDAAIEWVKAQRSEVKRLKDAIQLTIDENMDLADGDICTLIHLKRAIGMD